MYKNLLYAVYSSKEDALTSDEILYKTQVKVIKVYFRKLLPEDQQVAIRKLKEKKLVDDN